MFAKWKFNARSTPVKHEVIAEENERLKKEIDGLKSLLENETSLLEEEKSLLDDTEDIVAKLMHSEQARKSLQEENEILAMELYKARKQLKTAAKTFKILSSAKIPYNLLNSLLSPPLRGFSTALDKKALFDPKWRQIAALAITKDCSAADLIVFYQCGYVFGLTRDAKCAIFRAKIDSTICHAVIDERRGLVYYTAQFIYPGVYSVSLKKLEACRALKSCIPRVKTDTLISCPQWHFRGMAIDPKLDWLFACAKFSGANDQKCFELSYKVGVWDLSNVTASGAPLFFIEYDPTHVYLCHPFQPYYCAVYRAEKASKDIVLVVSDWRNSTVHAFEVDTDEQSCKFRQTVAVQGNAPGSVQNPCAVQFDRLGNLVVTDCGNKRLQLYAPIEKVGHDGVFYEPKWLSETFKSPVWSLAILQADDCDERSDGSFSDEMTDVLYVGINDSGKVLCVNTPCF